MNDLTFLDMVDQLTRVHPITVDTGAGKQIINEDGLLAQLREALFVGIGGSGGSQKGSKLPIYDAAYDLLTEIDTQAAEALADVDKRPTPYGHAEDYVRAWSELVDEDKRVIVSVRLTLAEGIVVTNAREYSAFTLVYNWYTRIRDLFNPPRKVEITAPCPVCGVRWLKREKDGQEISESAMWFRCDEETKAIVDVRCDACELVWTRPMLENFGRMIGAIDPDESLAEVLQRHLSRK